MSTQQRTCSIEGCDRPTIGRGWCSRHYQRWHKYGDPLRERPTAEERFWAKVDKRGPDECWLWTGSCYWHGYGQFRAHGHQYAHRFAYALFVGPIPEGQHLHHRCENTLCVNPAHLEPISPAEHLRLHDTFARITAAAKARKTCRNGHPHDTHAYHNGLQWICRECRRIGDRRRRAAAQKTVRAICRT